MNRVGSYKRLLSSNKALHQVLDFDLLVRGMT